LKENGIEFDRIVFLTDQSEEETGGRGKEIKDRKAAENDIHYDWDVELEKATKQLNAVKEYFN